MTMQKLSPKAVKKHNKQYKQVRNLVVVAEHIQYAQNVANLFRLADALAVKKVYLTGISHHPPFGKELQKVSRSKERVIPWEHSLDTAAVLAKLKEEGYTIIAIEQVAEGVDYLTFPYPEKVALVIGSEMHGMSKKTVALCDHAVVIPMYGKGASINVHVALAVVAYAASAAPLPTIC